MTCLRDALRFVGKPAPHAISLSVEAREQLAWMEKLLVDMAGALDNIDHIRRMLYVASPGCRGEYHPAQTDCDWCLALANLAELERVCLRAGRKTT